MRLPPDPSYLGLAISAVPMLVVMVLLAVRQLGQVRQMWDWPCVIRC